MILNLKIYRALCLLAVLWSAGVGAQDRVQNPAADTQPELRKPADFGDYVPGSSAIEEADILRRMERELGQEFTPTPARSVVSKKTTAQKAPRPAVTASFEVELVLGDSRRIAGRIALTQPAVELIQTRPEHSTPIRHRVPVSEIGQLQFENWKAVRIHESIGTPGARILFFPTAVHLVRKDGSELAGEFQAFDWLQFQIQNGPTSGTYRSYFTQGPASPDSADSAAGGTDPVASSPLAPSGPGNLTAINAQGAPQIPGDIIRSIVFAEQAVRAAESGNQAGGDRSDAVPTN